MQQKKRPLIPRTYWHDVLSRNKRALLGRGTITLNGRNYSVAYEARGMGTVMNVDYPLLHACARGRHCVFDVGANVGITAILMSQALAPQGKIFALEASEATCLVLRENILLNDLADRIEVVHAILGERAGELVPFHWDYFSTNASIMGETSSKRSIPLNAATAIMDDLIANMPAVPDFIKIDVEGAEALVVNGMQRTLLRHRPLVYVELHSWAGHRVAYNAGKIISTIEPLGYRMFDLRSKELVRDTTFIDHVNLGRYSVVSQDRVLLVPEEEGPPEWLNGFDTSGL